MKRILILALAAVTLSWAPELTTAGGQGRATVRPGAAHRGTVPRPWAPTRRRPVPRYYYYPNGFYYQPYYPPPVVISPYGPTYYQPPVFEVTAPYFCVLHNAGFYSRAGIVDHLAGTHKYPLESASYFCPDGVQSCIYPPQ
jgi:hypothetical protein